MATTEEEEEPEIIYIPEDPLMENNEIATPEDPESALVPLSALASATNPNVTATELSPTAAPPPAPPLADNTTRNRPTTAPQTKEPTSTLEKWERTFGPQGKWRFGLFECWDVIFCTSLCIMSSCGATHTILVGQLMERMGLDWCGQYNPWDAHQTCRTVTIIWVIYLSLAIMGVSFLVWPLITIWLLALATRVRGAIRDRFRIAPEHCEDCDGYLEDCLCACCCSCCSAIQMARQTHNEHKYPYTISSNTGLPLFAPVIFEHPTPQQIEERGSATNASKPPAHESAPSQQLVGATQPASTPLSPGPSEPPPLMPMPSQPPPQSTETRIIVRESPTPMPMPQQHIVERPGI